jgi:hypothetical protein
VRSEKVGTAVKKQKLKKVYPRRSCQVSYFPGATLDTLVFARATRPHRT